ncbi:glycosyltransferase family 4 protein [Metallibacterium scheffleri]|nr:glycosyltransferase family 4 protein [Metallibacterium scheffleri]
MLDERVSMTAKSFLVYWNNIPSPYMVERFNVLADRGAFEFEAWFNDRIEPGRSWDVDESTWRFKFRYLPTTRIGKRVLHWPLPSFGRRPDVLVSLYAEPVFILGWLVAKLRGAKTGFWAEVTFDRWIKRRAYKTWIKRWLFRRVDAIVTVGDDGRGFAERAGASVEKIFYAPHVIDVSHYANGARLARQNREQLRTDLGLHGTTFIYVGRLWWGKGLDYLLEAYEIVQARFSNEISLLLVGDGADEAKLRQLCIERGLRHVVFAGFKQKPEVPRYYASSDVFVFPTLGDPYGLVVDEAMACGLPVISTTAAGEIRDRIEEGVNGYIVPPEDSAALAERMLTLAQDGALRERMGKTSSDKIKGHTPERWAEDFERIVHTVFEKPPT